MTKGKYSPSGVVIIILILVVLFIVWIVMEAAANLKFDPDKDVCEECSHKFEGEGYLKYQGDCTEAQVANFFRCDKHRLKTKCEKNPNAEGCVCDEWKTGQYLNCYTEGPTVTATTNGVESIDWNKKVEPNISYGEREVCLLFFGCDTEWKLEDRTEIPIDFEEDCKIIEEKTCIKAHEE